jgi:spermidine synthase
MLASGFAGLGYQIVWTQQFGLWLGHESAAVLAVVAAFFGGLSLGALCLANAIERSGNPRRWYVACETLIGLWALVLVAAMPDYGAWLLEWIGPEASVLWHWSVAFCGVFVGLLPATAAMGATLPAMERIVAGLSEQQRSIAGLYATNTAGAVCGVLAAAFWLVPAGGLDFTATLCAGLNLACAVGARLCFPATAAELAKSVPAGPNPSLLRLAATGLLGIGYEVVVVRVLSQVSENTVYTFAMLLAVYLVGSATGAALYRLWRHRLGQDPKVEGLLFCAQATACLIGISSLWGAEAAKAATLEIFGPGLAAAIAAEALLALAAFGLPTVAMGALFCHLSERANAAGAGFGLALAVNTLGAAFAPLLFGVLLVPVVGCEYALLLIATSYLLISKPIRWHALPAGAAFALALLAPALIFVEIPEGGYLVSYREGAMAAVSVVEDADGVRRLRINNRQQEGSSATLLVDGRQALLPVLLHPSPQTALFLGLGTGTTAATAAADPSLRVDAVELLPEVIATTHYFGQPFTETGLARLRILDADARRYVKTVRYGYDVVVADNFHPARSGSGALYTVEHFKAVRDRLNRGGLFCQWLPLHQLDLATLRSIVKSFVAVYPNASMLLASNSLATPVVGLIGHNGNLAFLAETSRKRLGESALPKSLAEFGIEDEFALLGGFVAGPAALARFSEGASVNTDDHPIVIYTAPRITYAPDSQPGDRLLELLRQLELQPTELFSDAAEPGWNIRVAAYWRARDLYLAAGRTVTPSADVRVMLAQVREPLLAALRISPDFRPAYDPLIRMAIALSTVDLSAARVLALELSSLQPERPEAARLLERLGG